MAEMLEFPRKKETNATTIAIKAIEDRLGISFSSYMEEWTDETKAAIERSMLKETMVVATKNIR